MTDATLTVQIPSDLFDWLISNYSHLGSGNMDSVVVEALNLFRGAHEQAVSEAKNA